MKRLCLTACLLGLTAASGNAATGKLHTYSLQLAALAPNAGGQESYALRRGNDDHEWSIFANTYLMTGPIPLSGITYDWRFPICGQSCFWQFFVQTGVGLSSAGPMAELAWSTIFFWVLRIDVTTQMYVTTERVIVWSYPAWFGFSLPL